MPLRDEIEALKTQIKALNVKIGALALLLLAICAVNWLESMVR